MQQSEWAESFDAQSFIARPVATTTPILSAQTVPAMEQAIYVYQDLVARGGWPSVPADMELRIGVRDPRVVELRRRLIASGDLRQTSGDAAAFDSYVQAAVKQFQERHGLPGDGVVGAGTLQALNVPAYVRLAQLQANVERIKAMGLPSERYIMVNIPARRSRWWRTAPVVSRHIAVVGKVDRQTPILKSSIYEIRFNPFWTVPASHHQEGPDPEDAEGADLSHRPPDPHLQPAGHGAAARAGELVHGRGDQLHVPAGSGRRELARLREAAVPQPYDVYLHDTPAKNLFGSDYRFESSGCVRVFNVRELVAWVLRDTGYDRARVDETIRSGERLDVEVMNPPSIYTVYFTAWTTGDGVVHFRDDIYGLDSQGAVALAQDPSMIGSPVAQQ